MKESGKKESGKKERKIYKSFVFGETIRSAANQIKDFRCRAEFIFKAIDYGLDGTEPVFESDMERSLWAAIRDVIDNCNKNKGLWIRTGDASPQDALPPEQNKVTAPASYLVEPIEMKTPWTDDMWRDVYTAWNDTKFANSDTLTMCRYESLANLGNRYNNDVVFEAFKKFSVDEITKSRDNYIAIVREIKERGAKPSTGAKRFNEYKNLFSFLEYGLEQYTASPEQLRRERLEPRGAAAGKISGDAVDDAAKYFS